MTSSKAARRRTLATRSVKRKRRRVSPIAAIAAGIIGLGLIAFLVPRGEDGPKTLSTASVSITGDKLPQPGDTADTGVGMTIPEVRGKTFDGSDIAIKRDGRPKAIVFLAHWCPHCEKEVPVIVDWVKTHGVPEGIDMITVVTMTDANRPNYPPSAWLEREHWTLPVLLDNRASDTSEAYGLTGTPYWVFADSQGRVVKRASGEMTVDDLNANLALLH